MFVERRSKEAKFVFERNKMDQQDEVSTSRKAVVKKDQKVQEHNG